MYVHRKVRASDGIREHIHWRDVALVCGFAFGLRLVFLALTADTYDYDEFVLLLLARDFGGGSVPYHDFMFFHPPGILVLLRLFDPFTTSWWPLGRILTVLVDTATAAIVWRIGLRMYDRRTARMAGFLYGLSPLALISATRVGQDAVITALGMLGLMVILTRASWRWSVSAGICLGLAIWVKYPAAYFVPIYVLAARRRFPVVLASAAMTLLAGMLPFHAEWSALYQQTVTFQRTRWLMDTAQRWQTTVLFWLAFNAPAVIAIPLVSSPYWLQVGFGLGGLFVLASQVYYHYFVTVVPFAALLAAPLVCRLGYLDLRTLAPIGLALTISWGLVIQRGGSNPLYVTAAHLSDIASTVHAIRKETSPSDSILADRYEYAYLANRGALAHYFWNVGVLVDAHYLERRLGAAKAVVVSRGASSGYPAGMLAYLNARFPRRDTGAASLWRVPDGRKSVPAGE